MTSEEDADEKAKFTPWHDSPPDLLKRIAKARAGDLIVTRRPGKASGQPYLLIKLPIKMSEPVEGRIIPYEAIGMVLARHNDEWHRDCYLLVLCDDFIGWISPDLIDRFLNEEET